MTPDPFAGRRAPGPANGPVPPVPRPPVPRPPVPRPPVPGPPVPHPPGAYPPGPYPPGAYPPGAYGPGPYGPFPPGPSVPPRRNGLALASLVLAAFGAVCVSLPLAIAALVRVRRTGGPGTGLAVGGIVVSVVWIAVGSLAAALAFAVAEDLEEVSLRPGVCFNAEDGDESLATRTVTDCAEPHVYQVLSVENLAGGPYPGDGEVERQAAEKCDGRWSPALLQSPYIGTHELSYVVPTRVSWSFDKTVACILESVGGKKLPFADLPAVQVDPARKAWADLAVADCFEWPGQDSYTVRTVACDGPHDAQVVKIFFLAKGRWPGQKRLDDRIDSRCGRVLDAFFDAHPPGVRIAYGDVGPTRVEWSEGNRRVHCVVQSGYEDQPLTTSLVP